MESECSSATWQNISKPLCFVGEMLSHKDSLQIDLLLELSVIMQMSLEKVTFLDDNSQNPSVCATREV